MASSNFSAFKALAMTLLLALAVFVAYEIAVRRNAEFNEEILPEEASKPNQPFAVEMEEIKEENFSGDVARISGQSRAAKAARAYIDDALREFKIQADQDVPAMRAQFGYDSPPSTYAIDVKASRVAGQATESIVVSVYTYTGGAHGSTAYKVFTTRLGEDALLSLRDIVPPVKQEAFTRFVKDKLLKWQAGGAGPVVFEEDVEDLEFGSFSNWALDAENLILYFSQYEIGPGALGAVEFPIPLSVLGDFSITI